jgi:hypothetical protein
MDEEGLGYMWDFYGSPGYADYPEECDEGIKEDRVQQRPARIVPDGAAARPAPRSALSRLILGFAARFRRPEVQSAAPRGQELYFEADRP